jgi:hypothetical protein
VTLGTVRGEPEGLGFGNGQMHSELGEGAAVVRVECHYVKRHTKFMFT